jgi:hypothetical protein
MAVAANAEAASITPAFTMNGKLNEGCMAVS